MFALFDSSKCFADAKNSNTFPQNMVGCLRFHFDFSQEYFIESVIKLLAAQRCHKIFLMPEVENSNVVSRKVKI